MGTATKTGQPPDFKAATDLSTLIPGVGASVGIGDIAKAIEFYKKNRGAIAVIIGFLKGLFGGGKDAGKPSPLPVPEQPSPLPVPTPKPVPSAPVPPQDRRVGSLRVKYFFIERKNQPGKFGGGRHILSKPEFDGIVSGGDYLRLGDRVHVDITPVDQFGQPFMPGGEENRSLLYDPSGPVDTHNFRMKHNIISGGAVAGELTSEYDDYGCTPVILVPWEGGPAIDSDAEATLAYQPVFDGPDGRISGPTLPTLNIRA
jgi:hypothetical protein